jgi:hypothetical protein
MKRSGSQYEISEGMIHEKSTARDEVKTNGRLELRVGKFWRVLLCACETSRKKWVS